jgi:hypothetical protein
MMPTPVPWRSDCPRAYAQRAWARARPLWARSTLRGHGGIALDRYHYRWSGRRSRRAPWSPAVHTVRPAKGGAPGRLRSSLVGRASSCSRRSRTSRRRSGKLQRCRDRPCGHRSARRRAPGLSNRSGMAWSDLAVLGSAGGRRGNRDNSGLDPAAVLFTYSVLVHSLRLGSKPTARAATC